MREKPNTDKSDKEAILGDTEKQANDKARNDMLQRLMDPGFGVTLDPAKIEAGQMPKPPTLLVEEQGASKTDEDSDPIDVEEFKDSKGKSVWLDTPTYDNQYAKYPTTCRVIGPQIGVFNMTDPKELADLNRLLLMQIPEEAPSVLVQSKKENFYEGKWLMLLEYFRVEYKKLITD